MTQQTGTIERLSDRGYGFIRVQGERKNTFFHATGVRPGLRFTDLEEGDSVTFTTTETDRGPAAIDVEVIGRPLASLPHGRGEDDNVYDWGAAS
jgi:cold shock CspA family protein